MLTFTSQEGKRKRVGEEEVDGASKAGSVPIGEYDALRRRYYEPCPIARGGQS